MKNLGNDVPFTFFVIGHGDKFDHVAIICDKEVESIIGCPLFGLYINDILTSFTPIGTLKSSSSPKPSVKNSLNASCSNSDSKLETFALYRSGCVLESLGKKFVYRFFFVRSIPSFIN